MGDMTKKTTSFNIDKAVGRISKPSIFDRIVTEVNAKEIPSKYIEQILVQYYDGNIVELKGDELSHPIPLNKNATWQGMEDSFKKIKDVKIFISTNILEVDIDIMVEKYLGKHC